MTIKVKTDHMQAISESAKRQKVGIQFGTIAVDGYVGAWGVANVVVSVAVSLVKDCPTSYKFWTADAAKPAYIDKNDERFKFEVVGGVLIVTGKFRDLKARKFL